MIKRPKKTTDMPRCKLGVFPPACRASMKSSAADCPSIPLTSSPAHPEAERPRSRIRSCSPTLPFEQRALYFTVLGEPAIKMLRYQQQFSFFDMSKIDGAIRFVNLSQIVLDNNLGACAGHDCQGKWKTLTRASSSSGEHLPHRGPPHKAHSGATAELKLRASFSGWPCTSPVGKPRVRLDPPDPDTGHHAKDLPAVALSAFVHKNDRRQALFGGVSMHVPKPADPHDLTAVIASLAGAPVPQRSGEVAHGLHFGYGGRSCNRLLRKVREGKVVWPKKCIPDFQTIL